MKPDSSRISGGSGFEYQLMTELIDLWIRQALVRRMTRITREANRRHNRSILLERQVALTRRRRRQLSKTTDSLGSNDSGDESKER